jgi:hypothetical protein
VYEMISGVLRSTNTKTPAAAIKTCRRGASSNSAVEEAIQRYRINGPYIHHTSRGPAAAMRNKGEASARKPSANPRKSPRPGTSLFSRSESRWSLSRPGTTTRSPPPTTVTKNRNRNGYRRTSRLLSPGSE